MPPLDGRALTIHFLPSLTADRKRLYSNQTRGNPVHAGTSIRERKIVLDAALRGQPAELARILVHEVFHFAWVRLSNQQRRSYEQVVRREFAARARGELGWSAELRKPALPPDACRAMPGRKWREYLCESFCDTAAWLYSGARSHAEFTLADRHRARRARWFQQTFRGPGIPI